MLKPKVLMGHTSESNAYVVNDYPYGFKKRCKIRFWIETNGKGQRVCSQTTNPDHEGEVWNKVKRSSYTDLRIIFIEPDTGHVKDAGLGRHATKREVDAFLDSFGEESFKDEYSSKTLELMRKYRSLMIERFSKSPENVRVGEASGE